MGKTVANQKIIIIKKTPCKSNFLQVSNEEWMQAAVKCEKSFAAFKLYLYLAGNEVGYNLALSQVAVEQALGIKKTGYYDAISKLQELGYLVDIGKNQMEFYTALSATAENSVPEEKEDNKNSALAENSFTEENSVVEENSFPAEKNENGWIF